MQTNNPQLHQREERKSRHLKRPSNEINLIVPHEICSLEYNMTDQTEMSWHHSAEQKESGAIGSHCVAY